MKKTISKTPNRRLKFERELRGWSQDDVAQRIGSDRQNVGRWERGKTSPSPFFRQRLCELFDKNAQELGLVEDDLRDSSEEAQEQRNEHYLARERRPPLVAVVVVGLLLVVLVGLISFAVAPFVGRLLVSSVAPGSQVVPTQPSNSFPLSSPNTGKITPQPGDSATLVATSKSPTVRPNERFTISFTVINNGSTIWSDAGKYRLTCTANCMGGEDVGFGGQKAVPGQTWQFIIHLTAPGLTGTYPTTRILEHNKIQFGPSMSIPITISIRPGGVWIYPDSGQTISDII